jgi:PAS domain S-box-containing protein
MIELRHMHVLLVEDNLGDARLVQLSLKAETMVEFDVVHVDTIALAKERLKTGPVDAVLLDLSLPDSFGMNTVRAVIEAAPTVPIVVLTGLDDAEVGYRAVMEGAQDYLVKGHADGDQLRRAILYAEYRKSSQLMIESLNQRLDHILTALGEGVVGLDMSGKIIFHNPAILQMCGLSPEQIVGGVPQEALGEVGIHANARAFPGSEIAQTLEDGEVRHVSDAFLTRGDGTHVPVDYIVTPMKDGDGIEGAVVAYRDVSDRQQAFDVLQRQLGFHQKMIDALPLPLFYLDPEFVVLGCNLAFERQAKKSAFSMLGQYAHDVLPEEIAKILDEAVEKVEAGENYQEKLDFDGQSLLVTITAIEADTGELLGCACSLSRL